MDYRRWVRDAAKVHACLHEAKDGSILTSKKCAIYIPERYAEKQLASIGAEVYILGIFALVVEDRYYAVSSALAKIRLKNPTIATVKFDGDNYLEFTFEPGSVVIADKELVKDDILTYYVFEEFITKGRVPWFMNYQQDLAGLFDTAELHAGVKLGNNHVVLEIIVAAITRNAKDPTVYYRHLIQKESDLKTIEPVTIPLRSVSYGATNTTSKLVGSYFGEGLTSALVNPSEKVETIETILRM